MEVTKGDLNTIALCGRVGRSDGRLVAVAVVVVLVRRVRSSHTLFILIHLRSANVLRHIRSLSLPE